MGVVQVLGQKARVCSITYDPANVMETAQTTVQHFISAPMAMADGKGTTTYDALETAFGTALKIDGTKERCQDMLMFWWFPTYLTIAMRAGDKKLQ